MSTIRRAAVLVAASALALTACGPSEDEAGGGIDLPATPPTAATPARPTTPPEPTTPASPTTGPERALFPCSTHDLRFTASLAEPTTSSYLLRITNKTGTSCRVLGHPVVTFGDLDGQATERGTAPGIEDALVLAPGRSAYAGLMGGPRDAHSRTVSSIAMTMNTESDLRQVPLTASTPGLNVSDANSVTAWMDDVEDALSE
ncbi:DUF4232 domain-containing protein [Streptomyces sp. NPDC058877]|uniref:DUF4232 domain-containing protein n=1 Tax=unclassified Streptomyces TaxID=2593676 RepID=UPI00368178FE